MSSIVDHLLIYGGTWIQIFVASITSVIPLYLQVLTCKKKVSRIWLVFWGGGGGGSAIHISSSVQFCVCKINLAEQPPDL